MSTDEYVPSETTVRLAYLREKTVGTAHDMEQARAEFDRFLARVRRDAAREALDGAVDDVRADWHRSHHWVTQPIEEYRDAHYPEETP